MNRAEAIKATKNGAIAACISGAFTLLLSSIAILTDATGTLEIWNDPFIVFDIVLIFACAWGIYKKSRFAAVLLFCYFIFAKVVIGLETGEVSGLLMSFILLYFYGKAIQGAYVYQKIEKAENPDYKTTPKWVYYIGIPFLVIFVLLLGIGLMTMTGTLPSTEVQAGSELWQKEKDALISNEIVSKDDQIEYFYSNGVSSILEGGSILTDDRVILYMPDENQDLQVYEIYFENVASVELVEKGDFLNDSVYQINSHEPDAWLQIVLSVENGGDEKFVEALRSKIPGSNL